MPVPVLRSFARKAKKPLQTTEKKWEESKEVASKEGKPKDYALINYITQRKLHLAKSSDAEVLEDEAPKTGSEIDDVKPDKKVIESEAEGPDADNDNRNPDNKKEPLVKYIIHSETMDFSQNPAAVCVILQKAQQQVFHAKGNYKYVRKEMKNGKWVYYYTVKKSRLPANHDDLKNPMLRVHPDDQLIYQREVNAKEYAAHQSIEDVMPGDQVKFTDPETGEEHSGFVVDSDPNEPNNFVMQYFGAKEQGKNSLTGKINQIEELKASITDNDLDPDSKPYRDAMASLKTAEAEAETMQKEIDGLAIQQQEKEAQLESVKSTILTEQASLASTFTAGKAAKASKDTGKLEEITKVYAESNKKLVELKSNERLLNKEIGDLEDKIRSKTEGSRGKNQQVSISKDSIKFHTTVDSKIKEAAVRKSIRQEKVREAISLLQQDHDFKGVNILDDYGLTNLFKDELQKSFGDYELGHLLADGVDEAIMDNISLLAMEEAAGQAYKLKYGKSILGTPIDPSKVVSPKREIEVQAPVIVRRVAKQINEAFKSQATDTRARDLFGEAKKLLDTEYEEFLNSFDQIRAYLPPDQIKYFQSLQTDVKENKVALIKPDGVRLLEDGLAEITEWTPGLPIPEFKNESIAALFRTFRLRHKSDSSDRDTLNHMAFADLIDFSRKFGNASKFSEGRFSKNLLRKSLSAVHVRWAEDQIAVAKRRQEQAVSSTHFGPAHATSSEVEGYRAINLAKYQRAEALNSQRLKLYKSVPLEQWDHIINKANEFQDRQNKASTNFGSYSSDPNAAEQVQGAQSISSIGNMGRHYEMKLRDPIKREAYYTKATQIMGDSDFNAGEREALKKYYFETAVYVRNGLYGHEPMIDKEGIDALEKLSPAQMSELLSVYDELPSASFKRAGISGDIDYSDIQIGEAPDEDDRVKETIAGDLFFENSQYR
jgi:hypothetical protein